MLATLTAVEIATIIIYSAGWIVFLRYFDEILNWVDSIHERFGNSLEYLRNKATEIKLFAQTMLQFYWQKLFGSPQSEVVAFEIS